MDEDFVAILYCPVCCTNLDTEGSGWLEFVCGNCETSFKVYLDPAIVATHSLT